MDNREIAHRLRIAPGTVRNTLSTIYDAVGVSSRAYLATLLAAGRLSNGGDGDGSVASQHLNPHLMAADVRHNGASSRPKRGSK